MSSGRFTILYRWRIRAGREEAFTKAWEAITLFHLGQSGSHGSRLHVGEDGIWYAYAQWPSAEARQNALSGNAPEEAVNVMRDAIEERLPEIILSIASDHLS